MPFRRRPAVPGPIRKHAACGRAAPAHQRFTVRGRTGPALAAVVLLALAACGGDAGEDWPTLLPRDVLLDAPAPAADPAPGLAARAAGLRARAAALRAPAPAGPAATE